MQKMGCHLEVAFANLPESLLTSPQLESQGLSVFYHHAVREVHTQVCAARDENARLSQVEGKQQQAAVNDQTTAM